MIELWEDYEVEVPVDSGKGHSTVEARETLESSRDETEEVRAAPCCMLSTASAVHVMWPAAVVWVVLHAAAEHDLVAQGHASLCMLPGQTCP